MNKIFLHAMFMMCLLASSAKTNAQEHRLYDFVVPRDGSFREALKAANNRKDTTERYRIFVMQGKYKIPTEGTTTGGDGKEYGDPRSYLKAPKTSIIGEYRDNTVLTNTTPPATWNNGFGPSCPLEGIGKGDVLIIESQSHSTYLQDITMKSGMGDHTGRNIVLQDRSDFTIAKNICIWGYQDTYVSDNQQGRFYFDGGIIRGRTDYICGKGDVYYKGVTFQQCEKGGYLAVSSVPRKYGYVMQYCYIKSETPDVTYYLGRPWGKGTPTVIWLNTKVDASPITKDNRGYNGWADMSGGYPKQFAEFNTMLTSGETLSLEGRRTQWTDKEGNTHENKPTLNAFEASHYTMENVLDGWNPTADAEQMPAPKNLRIHKNRLSWDNQKGALLYTICKNGKVIDFTTASTYKLKGAKKGDVWGVRAANQMGGLGNPAIAVAPNEDLVQWDTIFIDGPKGKLHCVLIRPDKHNVTSADGRYPAAVYCHGFSGTLRGNLNERIGENLAAAGIASIRFDFNGHGESEGRFQDMTVSSEIADAKTVVNWLKAQPWCNGNVAIAGVSQGGVVAGMTAGEMGSEIKCAALMCPAAVLRDDAIRGNTMGKNYNPLNIEGDYVLLSRDRRLGKAFIEEAFALDIFGTTQKFQGPMIICHGTGDTTAPYTYGQGYHYLMPNRSRLYLIPSANHSFSNERMNVAQLVSDFFIEHLK